LDFAENTVKASGMLKLQDAPHRFKVPYLHLENSSGIIGDDLFPIQRLFIPPA